VFALLVSIMDAFMLMEARILFPSLRWLVLLSAFIPPAFIMDTCILLVKILLRVHVDQIIGLLAFILLASIMDAFIVLGAKTLSIELSTSPRPTEETCSELHRPGSRDLLSPGALGGTMRLSAAPFPRSPGPT